MSKERKYSYVLSITLVDERARVAASRGGEQVFSAPYFTAPKFFGPLLGPKGPI